MRITMKQLLDQEKFKDLVAMKTYICWLSSLFAHCYLRQILKVLENDLSALEMSQILVRLPLYAHTWRQDRPSPSKELFAAFRASSYVDSLTFAHALLSVYERKRVFPQAIALVYVILYPTLFDDEPDQKRPTRISTRTYERVIFQKEMALILICFSLFLVIVARRTVARAVSSAASRHPSTLPSSLPNDHVMHWRVETRRSARSGLSARARPLSTGSGFCQ